MGVLVLNQVSATTLFRPVADRFMQRAARGKLDTEAIVDQLEVTPAHPHRQLRKAANKAGMGHFEFLARLRLLVASGAYGDNQMRCVGDRLRELLDSRWKRPEIRELQDELAELIAA